MRIRYFAAAAAAAGTKEENFDLSVLKNDDAASPSALTSPNAPTLGALLGYLSANRAPETVKEAVGSDGTVVLQRIPSLARVLSQSSFLVNGKNERSKDRMLLDSDVVDILPPFAGG